VPLLGPFLVLLMLLSPPAMFDIPNIRAQQQQNPASPDPQMEFYTGYVAELGPEQIVVARTQGLKGTEKRTFKIVEATKIEGKLRAKVRVTVGYAANDDGDVAQRIIVRESITPKKKG
jgi:PBP1b-binding outer membrane lipoprotein LpoB